MCFLPGIRKKQVDISFKDKNVFYFYLIKIISIIFTPKEQTIKEVIVNTTDLENNQAEIYKDYSKILVDLNMSL